MNRHSARPPLLLPAAARAAVARKAARADRRFPADVRALRRTLALKAAIDYGLGALLLVLLGPVMLACLALTRLTSAGPALYRQKRVGQFGRVFTIYKIRTMYHDCEKYSGARWSTPGDSRITPLGGVFRKLHLDELPQLINVLRGEMSLIGPRPERPEIGTKLRSGVARYDQRVAVKPGVSGYAQVHLPPDTSVSSVRAKVAHDRHYMRNVSAWLDVVIMFWTGLKVFGLYPPRPAEEDVAVTPHPETA